MKFPSQTFYLLKIFASYGISDIFVTNTVYNLSFSYILEQEIKQNKNIPNFRSRF